MSKKPRLLLFLIILLSFFLRIYRLDRLPLYGDELTMVYDSYSILKTGRDQLGNFLPLTFRMGAGRPAGYVYFSIPFVALFGPTVWGVRLLSFLSGLGLVILMYFLGKKLFNRQVGIIASFLTAISFWDISLSRVGFEAHFALFLALLGIVSLLYAKNMPWPYLAFSLSWSLAIHTYPVYKLVLFLFLPTLVFYIWDNFKSSLKDQKIKLFIFIAIFLGFIAVLLSAYETLIGVSDGRFFSLNVFSQADLKERIIAEVALDRYLSDLPKNIGMFFYNRPLRYILILAESYLKNFSTQFLFISGDGNPRHNMFEFGQMYYVDFILILLALIALGGMIFEKKKRKILVLLFLWLFIAPLGSFLLLEQHALRNSFMLPPLILLSSLGFVFLLEHRRNIFMRFFLASVVFAGLAQLLLGLNRLYFLSPNKNANFWSAQAMQAFYLAETNKSKYRYVFLSKKIDNIEYAYQVYGRIDPREVIKQNLRPYRFNNYDSKIFGNVLILDIPKENLKNFLLRIGSDYFYIGDLDQEKDYLEGYESIDFKGIKSILIKKG